MNFISREQVIAIVNECGDCKEETMQRVKSLFSFPAPNPNWQHSDKNIMGQTEDEFWAAVDRG